MKVERNGNACFNSGNGGFTITPQGLIRVWAYMNSEVLEFTCPLYDLANLSNSFILTCSGVQISFDVQTGEMCFVGPHRIITWSPDKTDYVVNGDQLSIPEIFAQTCQRIYDKFD